MLLPEILLLILIQFIIQPCYSERIIRPLNGEMYAELNKNYSLVCHWGPGTSVEWMDSQGNFIDIRFQCQTSGIKTTKIFPDAITSCDHIGKTATLHIRNITKNLNGTKIKCATDYKVEEFEIKVFDKTDLLFYPIITVSKNEIYDGEEVEVKCHWNFNIHHIPIILKCGKVQKEGRESAVLKLNVTKEWNKKHCTCEGIYGLTHIMTHNQMTVYSAPDVYVNNLTVFTDTTAVLNCTATDGYPETYTYLEWHHLFNNVLLEKRRPSEKDGSLVIPEATWQDEGTWICFVSNGKYNQSSYGHLTVTGPPVLQSLNSNIEAISGTDKKLEVQMFPFFDHIDIAWKHNGRKISKGTPGKFPSSWQQRIKGHEVYLSGVTLSLALNNIEGKDGGNYSVSVVTQDGNSCYSFQMEISTKPNMTIITASLICGALVIILLISIFSCIFFCSRRRKHHSSIIDPSMSTPRTRIFSVPKSDPSNFPTSNLELDIYEEIDDWNYNDFKKKQDDYLNPSVIRYA